MLVLRTGVRFPSSPYEGMPRFRLGSKVVSVDGTKPQTLTT